MAAPKMRALILDAERKTATVQFVAKQSPGDHEVLVHVTAIALNPVDALYVFHPLGATGRIVGSDFAGTVVQVGNLAASNARLQIGDRVAGFLQGACSKNDLPGAFAEYLTAPSDLVWKVPGEMSLEGAATVSLCALTAAQALYLRLQLPAPFALPAGIRPHEIQADSRSRTRYFLIYGASTSVAMYAAPLVLRSAKAHAIPIKLLGVASRARWSMLRADPYNYDYLVDYKDGDWHEQVRAATAGQGVDWAFDCISEGQTVSKTASTLRSGGNIAIVRSAEGGAWDVSSLPAGIRLTYGAVWEGLGRDVEYQNLRLPASKQARSFAVAFYKWLSGAANIEANPIRLMPGGLEHVVRDGFTLLGTGSMDDRANERQESYMQRLSAEKMVYRVRSTD